MGCKNRKGMQSKGRKEELCNFFRMIENHEYFQCAQINRVEMSMSKECVFYNWFSQNPEGEVSLKEKWRICKYTLLLFHSRNVL